MGQRLISLFAKTQTLSLFTSRGFHILDGEIPQHRPQLARMWPGLTSIPIRSPLIRQGAACMSRGRWWWRGVTLREGLYKWPLHVGTCPDISPQLICSDVQQHEQGHEGGVKREHNYLRCPTNWARSSACRFRNWLCNFRRPWGRSSAGGGHRNLNFNGNNQNEAWNKEKYHSSMCACTIKTYSCNTYIIYSACPSSLLEH